MTPKTVLSRLPVTLLRAEGIAVFLGAIAAYIHLGASGLLFVLLIFAPDLSMIGYLRSPAVGAALYNAIHTYTASALLIVVGLVAVAPTVTAIGLIWSAHIGMDRAMGYGLKYPTAFKDTHLQRL